jgi:hypothetical protein
MMKRDHDVRRLLRWYPSSWRARYGDEFIALLEDRLPESPLTIRMRSSVAMAGLRERCYGSGMVGSQSSALIQRRTGSLTVLVAWSIMAVGGAGLTKMAEHFSSALPASTRGLADLAYDTTAVAGIVGTLFVCAGAIVAIPGLVRFLRKSQWTEIRQVVVGAAGATVALVAMTTGISLWAHHLNVAQRNGSDNWYSAVFLVFVLLVVTTIGLWTVASIAIASRISFTPRALRWESRLALGVTLSSLVVVGSAVTWWVQLSMHAPWFLAGTSTGNAASPWSIQVALTGFVMAFATATALWGALRIVTSNRSQNGSASSLVH